MSQSDSVNDRLDAPPSSKDIVRELCAAVHELSRQVTIASATADTAWGESDPTRTLSALRLELVGLGDSVTRLRWLSMALVSTQLEVVESTLNVSVMVKECLARVRPPLPESCVCVCSVKPGLRIHADLTLLVEGFSLLLNAASLRLRNEHGSAGQARLRLGVRPRAGKTVLRLAYNAPHVGPLEAEGHEELALKVFRSLDGTATVRGTKRWRVIHIRLPGQPTVRNAHASAVSVGPACASTPLQAPPGRSHSSLHADSGPGALGARCQIGRRASRDTREPDG